MRITRGNPHFLFKFRHSSKQDSHIVFINFRKLLHRQRIFSQQMCIRDRYLSTLVCAITDNTGTMKMFKASIFATFVIPVLIWAYTFLYKLTHKK